MSVQERKKMSFEELLDRDGYLAYTNVGTSMMPLLRQGKDVMEMVYRVQDKQIVLERDGK